MARQSRPGPTAWKTCKRYSMTWVSLVLKITTIIALLVAVGADGEYGGWSVLDGISSGSSVLRQPDSSQQPEEHGGAQNSPSPSPTPSPAPPPFSPPPFSPPPFSPPPVPPPPDQPAPPVPPAPPAQPPGEPAVTKLESFKTTSEPKMCESLSCYSDSSCSNSGCGDYTCQKCATCDGTEAAGICTPSGKQRTCPPVVCSGTEPGPPPALANSPSPSPAPSPSPVPSPVPIPSPFPPPPIPPSPTPSPSPSPAPDTQQGRVFDIMRPSSDVISAVSPPSETDQTNVVQAVPAVQVQSGPDPTQQQAQGPTTFIPIYVAVPPGSQYPNVVFDSANNGQVISTTANGDGGGDSGSGSKTKKKDSSPSPPTTTTTTTFGGGLFGGRVFPILNGQFGNQLMNILGGSNAGG